MIVRSSLLAPGALPLDSADDAVDRLGAKLIGRVIAPLALLTFVNAIDRVNVSFAAHALSTDIGLSPQSFGMGVSAFFVAYLIFQIPHAALLRYFGIRRWLLVTVTLWGLSGVLLSRVNTVSEFIAARFLLGMAEAGFAPGVTWFVNRWLPMKVRAKAMATVLSAVPFSLVVGGPLCGWMLGLGDSPGIPAWRWMFLMQALPNFALALVAFFYFRDALDQSSWLTPAERAMLSPAVDVAIAPASPAPIREVIGDPRIWRCALTWLLVMTGSYALVFWLPQLVRQMNIANGEFQIGFFSSLPQAALVVGMVLNARHSDRTGERRWHVGAAAMLGGAALMAAALLPAGLGALGLLIVSGFGIGAAQSVFWATPASMGIGNGRISVLVIALISIFGTAGGIVGPMLIGTVKQMTGSFVPSLIALGLMLVAGGFIIAPLGRSRDAA